MQRFAIATDYLSPRFVAAYAAYAVLMVGLAIALTQAGG